MRLTPIDDLAILVACILVHASRAYPGELSFRSLPCRMLSHLRWAQEWRDRQDGMQGCRDQHWAVKMKREIVYDELRPTGGDPKTRP